MIDAETMAKLAEHEVILGRHDERISDLEEHRKRQNGTLDRMAEDIKDIRSKFTSILGGLVASLILLVLNLIISLATRG